MKLMHAEKPEGKFVAIFNDGSGARLFMQCDNALLTAEGDHCDPDELNEYSHWIPLPDTFQFWFEGK